jgi:hypothetical protein
MDNEANPELIAKLQNFGLSADEWYTQIGKDIMNGHGISPEMLTMVSKMGVT